MADKRLRTMVFPGLEDTYTIPQDMNDLESIDAVAEPYDEFTAYAIGDYCSNGGKLYRCNTAIPSGETWNANHWTETNVGDEILAEKAATSTALNGKVSKAGDTMSGLLNLNGGVALVVDASIDTPPSTAESAYLYLFDANGTNLGYVRPTVYADGGVGLFVTARKLISGDTVFNGINFRIGANGTQSLSLSSPSAWRDALGLAATAFTPTRNTTNTDGGAAYGIYDPGANTVRIYGRANKTGGIPLSSQMFSIPSAYRPSTAKYGICVVNYSGGLGVGGIEVKANGDMVQVFSGSSTTLFFFIEYTL